VSAQVVPIKKTDSIAAMMPVQQFEAKDYLLMATQEGLIKKTPLSQFSDVRSNGLLAMKLKVGPLPTLPSTPALLLGCQHLPLTECDSKHAPMN
jgi:DNA gyrase/topoisomerase IV subunit A